MQKITTTGNATLIAYDGRPVLSTDPWIGDEDPAYFGSWVLSHKIPAELKKDIADSEYLWFSHGHPDHLNPISLERFRGKKILLPDHVGSRIFKDLSAFGYNVTILPDRKWVELTPNIRIQCITTIIQDSILLIDVCGVLFINQNDAAAQTCSRYIRKISRNYIHSYVMGLTGYGDTNMINFFAEDGSFITPPAAKKPSVGFQLADKALRFGAKSVIPFSSFHQYQRSDSVWAENYTTPMEAYTEGLSPKVNYIPPFSSIDCRDQQFESYCPQVLPVKVKAPEEFGDNWSEELDASDKKLLQEYFLRKDRVRDYFGFINFRVGGKDNSIKLQGKQTRGITFEVPRGSLMTSIRYRIFDDLLIGNFMKTTLHGVGSLYEGRGNFGINTAKYGDNGYAEAEDEIRRYEMEYRRRAGLEFIAGLFEDKSKQLLTRFVGRDRSLYKFCSWFYRSYVR